MRDGEVIIARGLEVDIARDLARRLGIPRVRFVYVKPASRLLVGTVRPWDLTIASIRPVSAASLTADLSDPYLGTDQAVVLRRGLPRLSTLGDLRRKITCAVRASDGARAIAGSVRPRVKPILALSEARLLELVQTGACDAALVDAETVGQFVAGRGGILGPVSAKVERGGGYVVAVTKGGPSPSPRSTAPSRGCAPTAPCTGSRGSGSGSTRPGCGRCAELLGVDAGHGRQRAPRERDPVVGAAPHVLAVDRRP